MRGGGGKRSVSKCRALASRQKGVNVTRMSVQGSGWPTARPVRTAGGARGRLAEQRRGGGLGQGGAKGRGAGCLPTKAEPGRLHKRERQVSSSRRRGVCGVQLVMTAGPRTDWAAGVLKLNAILRLCHRSGASSCAVLLATRSS